MAEVILSLDLTPEEREGWLDEIADWSESVELEMAETAVEHGWEYPHERRSG